MEYVNFKIKYRFLSKQEGGKSMLPTQGYRSDFVYADADSCEAIWCIWPQFLNAKGEVITDPMQPALLEGEANMGTINPDFILYHSKRLKIGTKGFFVEGSAKVAECEVIELIDFKERLKLKYPQ